MHLLLLKLPIQRNGDVVEYGIFNSKYPVGKLYKRVQFTNPITFKEGDVLIMCDSGGKTSPRVESVKSVPWNENVSELIDALRASVNAVAAALHTDGDVSLVIDKQVGEGLLTVRVEQVEGKHNVELFYTIDVTE